MSARVPTVPRPLSRAKAATLLERLASGNPEPVTELHYTNAYTLLIAVALSAQATDRSVNRATAGLFAAVDTPAAMLALGEAGLRERISSIGLFNQKAKNVLAAARLLVERHGGEVPRDRDALQALPGVGRKTANVVLNCWWGEETFAVDTHVFRVANRTRLAPGRTVDAVEAGLDARVPAPFRRDAHHWLILHGRYICKARTPECWRCPVADLCPYSPKTPSPGGSGGSQGSKPPSLESEGGVHHVDD